MSDARPSPPSRPPQSGLSARGLALAAGGRTLLSGLDLHVAPGERVALLGPSGVGKTTLLRTLATLVDPAAGALTLDGQPPGALGHPAWRRRVVMVAQVPAFHDLTVAAALARPFAFRAATAPFPEARARDLLAQTGLDPAAVFTQRARTLSVGQQQRVALVRALLVAPDLLLLDEPTSGLDAATTARVESLLAETPALSQLIVTHDPAQAARVATRVVDLAPYASPAPGPPSPEAP
ncbi:MAG: ATP-binding cassette domain-containing protein [Myxococcota bacterium]